MATETRGLPRYVGRYPPKKMAGGGPWIWETTRRSFRNAKRFATGGAAPVSETYLHGGQAVPPISERQARARRVAEFERRFWIGTRVSPRDSVRPFSLRSSRRSRSGDGALYAAW
jgi:hypothetical protein